MGILRKVIPLCMELNKTNKYMPLCELMIRKSFSPAKQKRLAQMPCSELLFILFEKNIVSVGKWYLRKIYLLEN